MRKVLFGVLFFALFILFLSSSVSAYLPTYGYDDGLSINFDSSGNIYVAIAGERLSGYKDCINVTKYDSSFAILQSSLLNCGGGSHPLYGFHNIRLIANHDHSGFYLVSGVDVTTNHRYDGKEVDGNYWYLAKLSTDISSPEQEFFTFNPQDYQTPWNDTITVDPSPFYLYSANEIQALSLDGSDNLYVLSSSQDSSIQAEGDDLGSSHVNKFLYENSLSQNTGNLFTGLVTAGSSMDKDFVPVSADDDCHGVLDYMAYDFLQNFDFDYGASDCSGNGACESNPCRTDPFYSTFGTNFFDNFQMTGWSKAYSERPLGVFVPPSGFVYVVVKAGSCDINHNSCSLRIAEYNSSGDAQHEGFYKTDSFKEVYSAVLGSDGNIYFAAKKKYSSSFELYTFDTRSKTFSKTSMTLHSTNGYLDSLLFAGKKNIYEVYQEGSYDVHVKEFDIDSQSPGFDYDTGESIYYITPTDAIIDSETGLYLDVAEEGNTFYDLYKIPLPLTCYHDVDGDGYGDPLVSQIFNGSCGDGYVDNDLDCDDSDGSIHPGATDVCGDGIDQDCSGSADSSCGCLNGYVDCYLDFDNDSYFAGGPKNVCLDSGSCSDQLGSGWTSLITNSSCPYVSVTSPYTGTCRDCDDSNATLGYLCCDSGHHFVYWKTQTFVPYAEVNPDDFGWNESSYYPDIVSDLSDVAYFNAPTPEVRENIYLGACCSSGADCYRLSGSSQPGVSGSNVFNCIGPNTFEADLSGSGPVQCSDTSLAPNSWLDCDASSSVCEGSGCGGTWALAGIDDSYVVSVNGSSYIASLDSSFGENDMNTHSECCGDDANEVLVTATCDGSTLFPGLCCPDSSYVALNASVCVHRTDCPDVMRGVPVWVNAPDSASRSVWDSQLRSSGDGYCCDVGDDNNSSKPLCDGTVGCFVRVRSMPVPQSSVTLCDNSSSDSSCVVESCSGNFSLCGSLDVCSSSPEEITYASYSHPVLTRSYSVSVSNVSYPIWENSSFSFNSSCDPDSRCDSRTVQICNKSDCFAFCEHDGSSFDDCKEVCDYSCENFTTYVGYDCYEGCIISGEKTVEIVGSVTVDASSDDYTVLNCTRDFGCTRDGVVIPDPYYFSFSDCSVQTSCGSPLSCEQSDPSLSDNKLCLQSSDGFGNDVFVRDNAGGDLMQCRGGDSGAFSINSGDPWCPEGFRYVVNSLFGLTIPHCEPITKSCDSGFSGDLLYGCDDILSPQNDSLWNQYNGACVQQLDSFAFDAYDRVCCLTSSVSGFTVYQYGDVRVY